MTDRALVLVEDSHSGACRKFARAARQLNLRPIMLSQAPGRIGYTDEDGIETMQVDTGNLRAVIDCCAEIQSRYKIVGATTASEKFYATTGLVCRHFGLPGPDPEAVEQCRDKFLQRERLSEAGIATPAFRLARNASVARVLAAEIGFPVIVKPVVGNASFGVKLCRDADEAARHTEFLLAGKHGLPPRPMVLIEAFAEGPFYTVSTIGGDIAAVSAATFSELPYFAMREFTFPAQMTRSDYQRATTVAKESVKALGLGWGPVNTEMRVTESGPVVIEVNPRIVGAPEPELIRLAYGIDLYTESIKPFLGLKPNLRRSRSDAAAAHWLMVQQNGVLERISGLDEARRIAGITDAAVDAAPGTRLAWHGDFRDVIGHVFAVTPNAKRTDAALRQALALIELSVASPPDQSESLHLKAG